MKRASWITLAILSVLVGLYPIIYFVIDKRFGLLGLKPAALLEDNIYNAAFYIHIVMGGLALLIGWLQFSMKLRAANLRLHRLIGQIYVISVFSSGLVGLYIASYASGGTGPTIGFIASDLVWLGTTILGLTAIWNRKISRHQKWMVYSYAACFSAVTLRIWLPLLQISTGNFMDAYRIVAWLSWVPNIMFAYYWTTYRMNDTEEELERLNRASQF